MKTVQQTCLCGRVYECKSYHIHLERILCEKCFVREAKIVLFKNRVNQLYDAGIRQSIEMAKLIGRMNTLRNERPYDTVELVQTKEFQTMMLKMSF